MSKSAVTALPTLTDLIADPTKVVALPPRAVAALAAAVTFATLTKNGEGAPAPSPDPGVWVGVGEAVQATGYPRRWFFRHRHMPFCKSPSRKVLLGRIVAAGPGDQGGRVKPSQPRPGAQLG